MSEKLEINFRRQTKQGMKTRTMKHLNQVRAKELTTHRYLLVNIVKVRLTTHRHLLALMVKNGLTTHCHLLISFVKDDPIVTYSSAFSKMASK